MIPSGPWIFSRDPVSALLSCFPLPGNDKPLKLLMGVQLFLSALLLQTKHRHELSDYKGRNIVVCQNEQALAKGKTQYTVS